MKVNSTTRVNALNADKVDSKSAANIGVNGLTVAYDTSEMSSLSYKVAVATCPRTENDDPKAVVGTGYQIEGFPYRNGRVVVTQVETIAGQNSPYPYAYAVVVTAVEAQPVGADWSVRAERSAPRRVPPSRYPPW